MKNTDSQVKIVCSFLSSLNSVKNKMENFYPKREVISPNHRNQVVRFSKEKYRIPS